jgi:hypothetical protein
MRGEGGDAGSQPMSTATVDSWSLNKTRPWLFQVSRDGYFFEDLNILISTFCVCADGFQGLSKGFHYPILSLTFYLLL